MQGKKLHATGKGKNQHTRLVHQFSKFPISGNILCHSENLHFIAVG